MMTVVFAIFTCSNAYSGPNHTCMTFVFFCISDSRFVNSFKCKNNLYPKGAKKRRQNSHLQNSKEKNISSKQYHTENSKPKGQTT